MASAFEFKDVTGQDLTKPPGSLNGESFLIKNLTNCSVYLLDYTSEVEVSNCVDTSIFIGPVDGPAIFHGCRGCQVAVACQQFQAKNCVDVEFGLYCATQPLIQDSKQLRFACWMGAYPHLTEHFAAANLDPQHSSWDKVYDISANAGEAPNFELVDAVHFWEVPIDGAGPCEDPVPAADGSRYTPSTGSGGARGLLGALGGSGGAGGLFGGPVPAENGDGAFGSFPENGHAGPVPPPLLGEEHPKVAAVRAAARQRLAKQEEEEAQGRAQLVQKAAQHLEAFYQKRNAAKAARAKANREAEGGTAVEGPRGDTEWEKTLSLINFAAPRPGGTDLSRFKSLLFTAKGKNVPISVPPAAAKQPAAGP